MSININKTGDLLDGSPLRRDHVPDVARSSACEGQVEGVPTASPPADASVSQASCEGAISGASSLKCREKKKEEEIEDETQEDIDKDDSIKTVIHNLEENETTEVNKIDTYVLPSCEVVIHRQMESPASKQMVVEGETPKRMKRKAVMESSEDSSDSIGISNARKVITARRKKSIISSMDETSGREENPFDIQSLSDESSENLISMHSVKKERKWSRISKEPSNIESVIGKEKSAGIREMGEKAIEWIEEVDTSRAKSKNLQGRTSGNMKNRLSGIKIIVEKLMERASDLGDPAYLRQLNGDQKKENKELKVKIKDLTKNMEKI
ncbi:hypothetical protein PUN28_010457 [Cardiocondyla obscurior]